SALFFFASRRRHTRCYRDWSSDVCSSDLVTVIITGHVQNPDSSVVETTLKVWALEPQKTSTYTKGKFGMRLNDFPIFSIKPYSTVSLHARGVALESIKWVRPADQRGRLDIIIIA